VFEHHSRRSGLPLILAALPEHHHLFRRVSHKHVSAGCRPAVQPGRDRD
jgi:hypothetical protein